VVEKLLKITLRSEISRWIANEILFKISVKCPFSGASNLQNLKTFLALTDELCCLGFIYPTSELTQVSGDRD
jgi:hypothetical protein